MRFSNRCGLLLSLTLGSVLPLHAQNPPTESTPPSKPLSPAVERSVVCGMTILSGRTAVDPKIERRPPAGNFTTRVLPRTTCVDQVRLPPSNEFLNRLPTFLGPKR
jgi:hypothetical protein